MLYFAHSRVDSLALFYERIIVQTKLRKKGKAPAITECFLRLTKDFSEGIKWIAR